MAEKDAEIDNEDLLDKDSDDNEVTNNNNNNNDDEFTEEELEAIDAGWNPDFEGPDARSARDFLDRGSFFNKIASLNKTIESNAAASKKQIEFLLDRQKAAEKVAVDIAIAELKAQKIEALDAGDNAAAVELDDQIADTKAAAAASADELIVDDVTTSTTAPAEYTKFVEKNSWYVSNKVLQAEADVIGGEYRDANPNSSLTEVFKHVATEIKADYPEYFMNSKKKGAAAVEGGQNNTKRRKSSKQAYTADDMDEGDKGIMRTMLQSGAVKSEQEYVDKLVASGYFANRGN